MDFIFISMPYARFISRWFANVPNINLGIMQSYLPERGKSVKTFHFHLGFVPYIESLSPHIKDNLFTLTEQYGVEYMGLDYIFASLFFEDRYLKSKERFKERLDSLGLSSSIFEELREVGRSFVDSCFVKLSPYLENARLIGFSCSHYQLSGSLLLCSKIKSARPDIPAVFGGKDCSGTFAYEFMRAAEFVDFTGTGECEITVDSLLDHVNNKRGPLYNVLYRDGYGKIIKSPEVPNIPINDLPFPEYDYDEFHIRKSDIILPIEFGRGCPWKRCSFCPDESYNILCQVKSPERITSEIDHYQSISAELCNYFILDSDALKNRESIIKTALNIGGKNINFIYAEFRAEKMDREVLEALNKMGNWVTHFQIGIETFSEGMLRLMNKGVSALKNVEVLKAAAELGISVQFNLFTCFPGMTRDDLKENIRVMDLISHILLRDNFSIFPGEFYLPPDSPVFLDTGKFGLIKSGESIFSSVFDGFAMPSYSNYPYPYQFRNDDDQYGFSMALRAKVEEIKSMSPADNFMVYTDSPEGLRIEACRDGVATSHLLDSSKKAIYLSAVEKARDIGKLCEDSGLQPGDIYSLLDDFESKSLIIYSYDRKSFLSLAMKSLQ